MSVMERRHYEFVASVIKSEGPKAILAYRFAQAFAKDNPSFNKDKFVAACGVDRTFAALDKSFKPLLEGS